MLDEVLRKIDEIWKRECLKVVEPFSEKEVFEKLANLGVPIAGDVIKVYSTLGGMVDGEMDSECLSVQTIERIVEENIPNSQFIYFADFLIDSHHNAFKFENEQTSSIHVHYSEKDRPKVADSFGGFFELYLTDIPRLFI